MGLASIVVAVLALGVLVIIHEAGHFFAARWGGMNVSRFSVGFGPALFSSERGGTLFQVGAIPFGGYVQIDGMHPEDGTDPASERSFVNRPRHLRAAAIAAGPAANYVLAFVMLSVFYVISATEPAPPFEVTSVLDGSPAQQAGLEPGDKLVGTSSAAFTKQADLGESIAASKGGPLVFSIERADERRLVSVVPKDQDGRLIVGIGYRSLGSKPLELGLGGALARAGSDLVRVSGLLIQGLVALVQRPSDARVQGPVGIVKNLSTQVEESPFEAFRFTAYLSIMLGFFNLLPIPALDGARLVFLLVGAVRRREVEPRLEALIHGTGFLALLGLIIVVSWFDIFS